MEEQGLARLPEAHEAADALIASSYLAGTNTGRVRRALAALFGGAVGKDTVSRVWRKVKRCYGASGEAIGTIVAATNRWIAPCHSEQEENPQTLS